ncbi:MAG TPA: fatty acid desaturase [Acidobacteriota bacterium]|jgi:hypothetical protein
MVTARLFRHSDWDALFVALAIAQAALFLAVPLAPVIALGIWWNANTISHNFIHKPFFHDRRLNALFSLYLSALLSIPQTVWRQRHLAHHTGVAWRLRIDRAAVAEIAVVLALWSTLLWLNPMFLLSVYFPAYAVGLGLCWMHGHYEHARGTVSHYGVIYNFCCFNDGFHVEHHREPGLHWRRLPERVQTGSETSCWPAPLRWLDCALEWLEKPVLRSRLLQNFVLRSHRRAFSSLLSKLPRPHRIAIVGGGLFPRTALILRELLPEAKLVLIDRNAQNIERARAFLDCAVDFVNARYEPAQHTGFDLVVIPLAFVGDRAALYRNPPAPFLFVHDWIWRRRGTGRIISIFLLKRLNLVRPTVPNVRRN